LGLYTRQYPKTPKELTSITPYKCNAVWDWKGDFINYFISIGEAVVVIKLRFHKNTKASLPTEMRLLKLNLSQEI